MRTVLVNQLVERIAKLYDDAEYCDLLIKCGGREFKVHKAIVCSGCEFLYKTCKIGDGGGFKDASEGIVTFKTKEEAAFTEDEGCADDPETIARAIEFLYKIDYHLVSTEDRPLTAHAKMFTTADRYGIEGLKELAQLKFRKHIAKSGLSLADLADTIPVVFKGTAESVKELRDVLKDYLVKAAVDVTGDKDVRSAIESIPRLPFELFQETKEKPSATTTTMEPIANATDSDDSDGMIGFDLFD